MENTDAPEPPESVPSSRGHGKEPEVTSPAPQPGPTPTPAPSRAPEREESRTDDRLEWASQQSTDTGSLDGSCRDLLNSSITSTTSTLVPGMLEEEEEEDEEEEDYPPEPLSVQVPPLSCRIESWVSKTLENLQLHTQNDDSTDDEDEEGRLSDEELDSSDLTEPAAEDKDVLEATAHTG